MVAIQIWGFTKIVVPPTNFISYSTICLTRSWGNEKHMPTKKTDFLSVKRKTERGKLVSSTVWSEKNLSFESICVIQEITCNHFFFVDKNKLYMYIHL